MRYQTLDEMLDALRIEARISQNSAHGLHLKDQHTYLLNRVQDDLYLNYDWPSLNTDAYVDLDPGTRYKGYPKNVDHTAIESVYAKDIGSGNNFYEIKMGIHPAHYNARDPEDKSQRATPIVKWQNYIPPEGPTNHNMFEVWPVPDRATRLLFRGKRKCQRMVDGHEYSTLDGPAIVMHAAAEILAAQKAEDAALKLNKAQERIRTLKLNQQAPSTQINLSRPRYGDPSTRLRYGLDYMPDA